MSQQIIEGSFANGARWPEGRWAERQDPYFRFRQHMGRTVMYFDTRQGSGARQGSFADGHTAVKEFSFRHHLANAIQWASRGRS